MSPTDLLGLAGEGLAIRDKKDVGFEAWLQIIKKSRSSKSETSINKNKRL